MGFFFVHSTLSLGSRRLAASAFDLLEPLHEIHGLVRKRGDGEIVRLSFFRTVTDYRIGGAPAPLKPL
jgi:hypothetical protein